MDDHEALAAYARARIADGAGALDQAAKGYAAALALSPQNELLAARAVGQALAAGDRPLALQAAEILRQSGKLTLEARLLLLTESLRKRDWKEARAHVDGLEQDELFAFMAPVLRAWIAEGSGKGDPLKALDAASGNALALTYAEEQKPLLLLVRGREKEALALLTPTLDATTLRGQRLRIAAAGLLARRGERSEALAMLAGDAAPLAAARRIVEAKDPLPGALGGAADGIAELLVRIAVDLSAQDVAPLGLSFARLATFLAPENSAAWLVTAEMLGAADQHDAAIAALQSVPARDPFASGAAERRVAQLAAAGRSEEALAELRAATAADPAAIGAWTQLGDQLSDLGRHGEAAEAYGKAVALSEQGVGGGHPGWALWLLKGGAHTQAGEWPQGKAALQKAYELAPEQAVVLNYLGYSQLERRENIVEAEKLIREASRLQPDDASITDSLGWALHVRGDHDKAIELLERAARGQPADAAINEHLGDAYYSAGRRFEARYAWAAALVYAEGEVADRIRAKLETGLSPELAAP